MPKIHELIPVEADKVTIANALVDEAIVTFAKKPDHFIGQIRTVAMYDTQREAENTTERKELVETVESKLDHVCTSRSRRSTLPTLGRQTPTPNCRERCGRGSRRKVTRPRRSATCWCSMKRPTSTPRR